MSPAISTLSRKLYIVGNRAPIAKVLMRIRLVLMSGSAVTKSASALPLIALKSREISSAFRTSRIVTSRPSARRVLDLAHLQYRGGASDVGPDRQPVKTRHDFAQKL